MSKLHTAMLEEAGETYRWVSLDGQAWLEVGDDPREYSMDSIRKAFEPQEDNGKLTGTITVATRQLRMWGAQFNTYGTE